MSEDLIRRSDAINAIHDSCFLDEIEEAIYELPTIEPKRGEWKGGDVLTNCSICGEAWDLKYLGGQEMWYTGELPNFCPNCGADMRSKEGE